MPTIKSISIEQYRGFFEKREIGFATPTGQSASGLTILVGPNNSGKTTVVTALRLLLNPRQVDVEERHEGHRLAISITTSEGTQKTVTNPDMGAVIVLNSQTPAAWPNPANLRLVPSRRSWNAYTGHQDMEQSQYWTTTYTQAGTDNYLVSRVARFTEQEKNAFNALLKELIPQIDSWRVELTRGQSFILYETKSGARHSADLFGDGIASLFRVALALLDSRDGYIVVIDEPELSLHPQAQKTLASVIARYAKDRQILITTHSTYLVRWADLSTGAQVYRLSQAEEGIAVGSLKPDTIKNLNKLIADWQKPNLLDAVAREVFFADEVVFLEGQEDVGLLKNYSGKK